VVLVRRERRPQREGDAALPDLDTEALLPAAMDLRVRRRVLHLYRLYAVLKAAYEGCEVRRLRKGQGPYDQFLKAVQMLEAFEART
jgi:hypothetical protein